MLISTAYIKLQDCKDTSLQYTKTLGYESIFIFKNKWNSIM
jgi:hypothetical protein